jgi:hypothetical protein
MGYVHDTSMSQYIFPGDVSKTAGTWTPAIASSVVSDNRTAAAAAFTLLVPIKLPGNGSGLKGAYLKSIDLFYSIATAEPTDFATVALNKAALPAATGNALTGATAAITLDGGHDTAAKRKTVGDHKLTVTLSTPVWIDEDETYILSILVDAAATTVFKLFGARASYTLRV